jgi:hypothetical protein
MANHHHNTSPWFPEIKFCLRIKNIKLKFLVDVVDCKIFVGIHWKIVVVFYVGCKVDVVILADIIAKCVFSHDLLCCEGGWGGLYFLKKAQLCLIHK